MDSNSRFRFFSAKTLNFLELPVDTPCQADTLNSSATPRGVRVSFASAVAQIRFAQRQEVGVSHIDFATR